MRTEARGPAARSTLPGDDGLRRARRGARWRALARVMLVALIGLGLANLFGSRTAEAVASGAGYTLRVTYPSATRPGLAIVWQVELTRAGGFDGPVEIATSSSYFDLFDENGFSPQPTTETADGTMTVWEFEPPAGDTLMVSFDARLEPGRQDGAPAVTQVLERGVPVLGVTYRTKVFP